MTQTDAVLAHLDAGLEGAIERLKNLLKIPSISTDPDRAGDCLHAAEWLAGDLTSIGFSAEVVPTQGHPMVLGHYRSDFSDVPHILFYGHYDVQPVDPLDLWDAPPFEPRIEKTGEGDQGRIVARGACDDKGQLMTFVEAMRAWAQEVGHLPINITVLFEGEEESGSASLPSFLEAHAEELKADVVFVCDTLMWDQQTPAITAMLRGMVAEEFTVRCANRDLHSGLYGNAARNPLNLVAQILGEMKDADGHIHIPGFYDDVAETNPEVLAQWKQLGFETDKFLGDIDLKIPAGEPDRHVLEQIWTRPTCDVNGIWGGYIEPGFKTVIPSEASAKLSFRLVTNQDPGKVQQGFRDFVEARIPADCTVSFKDHAASPAISMEASSHFMKVSDQQLAAEFGTATAFVGCGGSIPIVENFKQALGMDSILIGFGLENDNAHSPNEKYEISSFHKGTRFWARLLGVLGQA